MSTASTHRLSPGRVTGVLLILGAYLLYYPVNWLVSGGVETKLPFDDLIPLWPIWAVPYLLALPWWLGLTLWAALKMDSEGFKTLVIGMLVMTLSSYAVYILMPTYVERPPLVGEGWAVDLMRAIYSHDKAYNALPSGHTYNTTLLAIFWWRWQPGLKWVWAATVPVVILATLFTKQHYLLDPIFGLGWAFAAFFLATRTTGWRPERV